MIFNLFSGWFFILLISIYLSSEGNTMEIELCIFFVLSLPPHYAYIFIYTLQFFSISLYNDKINLPTNILKQLKILVSKSWNYHGLRTINRVFIYMCLETTEVPKNILEHGINLTWDNSIIKMQTILKLFNTNYNLLQESSW